MTANAVRIEPTDDDPMRTARGLNWAGVGDGDEEDDDEEDDDEYSDDGGGGGDDDEKENKRQ